jgi:hypothetical protein
MSKQILARFGVFLLIVANLGAYYVFWPGSAPQSPGNSEKVDNPGPQASFTPTVGAAQAEEPVKAFSDKPNPAAADPSPVPNVAVNLPTDPKPTVPAVPEPAIVLPAIPTPDDPVPVALPAAPMPFVPVKAEDPTIEQLRRLKASVAKENTSVPAPSDVRPFADLKNRAESPAPMPKSQPSNPWQVRVEGSGDRKVLSARLNDQTEVRIDCDRVDTGLDGTVTAIGKVAFSAPGLSGSCQRIMLGPTESLTLNGGVQVVQVRHALSDHVPLAEMSAEQLVLRLPPTAFTPVSKSAVSAEPGNEPRPGDTAMSMLPNAPAPVSSPAMMAEPFSILGPLQPVTKAP